MGCGAVVVQENRCTMQGLLARMARGRRDRPESALRAMLDRVSPAFDMIPSRLFLAGC